MTRASSDLARAALKTAVRRLLAGLGGTEAASTVTRVVKSKLHAYGDAQQLERNMPVDVVLDLEACLGQPVVTAELARQAGYTLIPMAFGEGDVAVTLAAVSQDCGRTMSDALSAVSHGMPPAETDVLLRDLTALAGAVSVAIGVLRARQSRSSSNLSTRTGPDGSINRVPFVRDG